jgi:hypothetical protein
VIDTVALTLGFDVISINDTEQFEKAFETLDPTIVAATVWN